METLADIYARHSTPSGVGDKGTLHSYIPIYEQLLAPYRMTARRLLEIGVAEGHSLRMWREFFPVATEIIGVDCAPCTWPLDGCRLILGDATRLNTYDGIDVVDIVIDDGSHQIAHQMMTFQLLWPRLSQGGLYVIEDVQELETNWPFFMDLPSEVRVYDFRDQSRVPDDVMVVMTHRSQFSDPIH